MAILYGIKNCDTVKKARLWLDGNGIAYQFHDYRADGLNAGQLSQFASQLGWQALINRSSTSWRQLSAEQQAVLMQLQAAATADPEAIQIILATPTLLKRPLLDIDGQFIIGFKADNYQANLGKLAGKG